MIRSAKLRDDKDLLTRISNGDKAAMGVFFERYHAPLYMFLLSRGGDTQEVEDAVQETMLAVWHVAGTYQRGPASVKTWLFTIGRNKLVDRVRKNAKVTLVEHIPDIPDDSPDAEAILISLSDAARVQRCLAKLKPPHLSVIRLAYFDGLSIAEISEIEGIPEGTVKSRIYHAKRLLLKYLGRR